MKTDNIILIKTVFNILNESGLDYCIQNKYEMMPELIPADIDMFYRNADEKKLDSIVKKIAEETGLVITQKIPNGYFQFAYMLSHTIPNHDFQLQLDFYPELCNKTFPHAYIPEGMLNNKRFYKLFYVPDYYDEIYYQIVRRIMKKDMSLDHIINIKYLISIGNSKEIKDRLLVQLGSELHNIILKILETNNLSYFYDNYDVFYGYMHNVCKKNFSTRKWLVEKRFKFFKVFPQRVLNPCGMSVAFIAPDGAGKSTVIAEITKSCAGSFHGVEYKYFRPRFFKNPGHYNIINPTQEISSNPDPHSKPVNSSLKSFFRYFFYNLDFLFGHLFLVFPFKIRRKLVIYDRYYYDYYVDMKRYQYKLPKFIPNLFSFMIPTPDLVFVLDASGQVLYDRKHELSVVELNRQRKVYQKVASSLVNACLIDAEQPIGKVIEDVSQLIIKKKVSQTSAKLTYNK